MKDKCAIKGKTRLPLDKVIAASASWLEHGKKYKVIMGK
jgi:hypothetical protein